MIMEMTKQKAQAALVYFQRSEDAEEVSGGGYVCDFYELTPPVSIEAYPCDTGLDVVAAFVLNYDEELGGYYLGEKIEEKPVLAEVLKEWIEALCT